LKLTFGELEAILKRKYEDFERLNFVGEIKYSDRICHTFVLHLKGNYFTMFRFSSKKSVIYEVKHQPYYLDNYDTKVNLAYKSSDLDSVDKLFSQFIGDEICITEEEFKDGKK
jgi:hypothetical protein